MAEYNSFDKVLHRQFLGNNSLSNFLYERLLQKSSLSSTSYDTPHIFITGLARSGTTALLNKIYSTGDFSSFLYKHMPFILSPTLVSYYSKLTNQQVSPPVERSHNDGILFGSNSPECLDEIFWIKSSANWYHEPTLTVSSPTDTHTNAYSYLLNRFSQIQSGKRMLVKNNNNHLRLLTLSRNLPNSTFIVLFRDPIIHAQSLLNQHLNFSKLHHKQPFTLEYMNLLGHREFGRNLAPFVYPYPSKNKHLKLLPTSLSYWLSQWLSTYLWILSLPLTSLGNIKLVCYEDLCTNPNVYHLLCNDNQIKTNSSGQSFRLGNSQVSKETTSSIDPLLYEESRDLYSSLCLASSYK